MLEHIIINTVWAKSGFANPMKGLFHGALKQTKENPVFPSKYKMFFNYCSLQ